MAKADSAQAAAWVDSAYARFAAVGLSGVKVEALAREIGTTKGSFYWHFPNRQALVDAVMQRWEREETEALIALADSSGDDPAARVRALYMAVSARPITRGGEVSLYLEAEAEGAMGAVQRVTQRRVDYLAGLLEAAGISAGEARNRSVRAVAAVAGLQQLMHVRFATGVSPEALLASALEDVLAPERS